MRWICMQEGQAEEVVKGVEAQTSPLERGHR